LFQLRFVPQVRGFTWDLHPLDSLAGFSRQLGDKEGCFVPIWCQFLKDEKTAGERHGERQRFRGISDMESEWVAEGERAVFRRGYFAL